MPEACQELLLEYAGGGEDRNLILGPSMPVEILGLNDVPNAGEVFVGCANVRIIPTFEITYSSKGICLVPMTIKFQSNLQASEEMSDPTVA